MPGAPSLVDALRAGLDGRDAYYDRLQSLGAAQGGVWFDPVLQGWVVVDHGWCEQLYRQTTQLGRGRMAPAAALLNLASTAALRGLAVLQSMSIFMDPADAAYPARRQRLLGCLTRDAAVVRQARVSVLAQQAVEALAQGAPVEVFAASLRPYAADCAAVAVGLDAPQPPAVLADALVLAAFFEGKRPAPAAVLSAFEAADRLAGHLAAALALDRLDDGELLADLLLLFVAAHESMGYLLYTAQSELARQGALACDDVAAVLAEAARVDAPVQMSGRVALDALPCCNAVIPAGDRVYLHVGAANRDPAVHAAPAEFRPGRTQPSLAFGWGVTRCLGAEYAQRCGAAYLQALGARFEAVEALPRRTRFDHGLAARGLHEAWFTYH